jgi:hypothetical protein
MELHHIVSLFNFFKAVGYGPLLTFLSVVIVAPWVALIWINYQYNKRFDKFEKVMEENKNEFKEMMSKTLNLSENYRDLSTGLQNLIVTDIEIMTQVKEMIKFLINKRA